MAWCVDATPSERRDECLCHALRMACVIAAISVTVAAVPSTGFLHCLPFPRGVCFAGDQPFVSVATSAPSAETSAAASSMHADKSIARARIRSSFVPRHGDRPSPACAWVSKFCTESWHRAVGGNSRIRCAGIGCSMMFAGAIAVSRWNGPIAGWLICNVEARLLGRRLVHRADGGAESAICAIVSYSFN
jgi:hypothetical protein